VITVEELKAQMDKSNTLDNDDRLGIQFVLAVIERMDFQNRMLDRLGDKLEKINDSVQTMVRRGK
jgi:hypothetical protein